MDGFEIIDHTADVGIIARASTVEDVFRNAARGMFSMVSELDVIGYELAETITVEAADREELLVAWLNELLYLFDAKHLIFKEFEILSLTETELKAKAYGEKIDLSRHPIKTDIKAATYHMLKIEKENGVFSARILLDL